VTPRTVKVLIPPDTNYVPLLRTTVAGIAARESFTLEEVDDLRMGVEEAAVLLLRRGGTHALSLDVTVTDESLEALLSTVAESAGDPVDESSFSWMILSALADKVVADHDEGEIRIVLTKTRSTR
jgi:serine/threonine-protein kinase RsbW